VLVYPYPTRTRGYIQVGLDTCFTGTGRVKQLRVFYWYNFDQGKLLSTTARFVVDEYTCIVLLNMIMMWPVTVYRPPLNKLSRSRSTRYFRELQPTFLVHGLSTI